ncbi:hypothetical protein Pcinc_043188, partial [Petrolisthes cinctipes]
MNGMRGRETGGWDIEGTLKELGKRQVKD